ncbi:hypothetical protein [Hyphomonas sp.]|uniref:hypothetical protein n=1 Tax=Hyphomonas sp. TaxID=87 RepID=UPI00391D0BDB
MAVPVNGWPRRQFGDISLAIPPGLMEDDEAPPGCLVALTALAPATLRIRKIGIGAATSLADILSGLTEAPPQRDQAGQGHVWPGLRAEPQGAPCRMHFLFESGGAAYHGLAEAPADLWADYGIFLEAVMRSIDPGGTPSPRLPLFTGQGVPDVTERAPVADTVEDIRRRLDEVSGEAVALIVALRFGEAEALVRHIDADIYGANALAGAYEAALEQSPEAPGLFDRALYWARSAFPDPHTPLEAEQYDSALKASEARLRKITGR